MVEYRPAVSDPGLDAVFAAVADPTRRAILARLRAGDAGVSEIAEPFAMSLNAVSKHLMVLERAGLVRRERVGREHRLSLEPAPLAGARDWLDHYRQFWEGRLDALERHLAQTRLRPRSPQRRRNR